MSTLVFGSRIHGAPIIAFAFGLSISFGTFQAHAANMITFGGNNTVCGGTVMCSTDGTHGYTIDGTGQAFNLSTISQWFQINTNGTSQLAGQPAEPDGNSGSFLVVNDMGNPVSSFSLTITDDFNSSTPSVHTCRGAQSGQLCVNFSANGGSSSYKFASELSGAHWDRCTHGTTNGPTCTAYPGSVAADFAPNSVTYTWTGQKGSSIPAGSYFVVSFAGWNNDAWGAPLVTNGGFETGDFTGWDVSGNYPQNVETSSGSYPCEEGNYCAQIAGNSPGGDNTSQTFSTSAGQSYLLSFWVDQQDYSPPGGTSFLNVTWDGNSILYYLNPTQNLDYWIQYTFVVTGTGSDILNFNDIEDCCYTHLDNVQLTPIP